MNVKHICVYRRYKYFDNFLHDSHNFLDDKIISKHEESVHVKKAYGYAKNSDAQGI